MRRRVTSDNAMMEPYARQLSNRRQLRHGIAAKKGFGADGRVIMSVHNCVWGISKAPVKHMWTRDAKTIGTHVHTK